MTVSHPGVKQAMLNAGLTPPAFDAIVRDYATGGLYNNLVTDKKVVQMLKAEGLTWSISELWARTVGGKPPTARDDVKGKLAEQINTLADDLTFWPTHQWWYRQQKDRGCALLSIGWADNMMGDELALPTGATVPGVDFIHVITRDMICDPRAGGNGEDGIVEGTRIGQDGYGQILYYWLKLPEGKDKTASTPTKIDGSRLMHWANPSPDGNKYGMSQFLPMWDVLQGKRQMDAALWRTVRRMASLLPLIKHPKGASEPQKTNARNAARYLDAGSVMDIQDDWGFSLEGTANALNPTPYINYAIDLIAAEGPGSKVVMMGVPAGKLAGSEVNERLFYSRAADEQRNRYGPKAYEFFQDCRRRGAGIRDVPGARWWWEFPPIRELDDQEKADMAEKLARTFETQVRAIAQATGQLFTTQTDEDGTMRLVTDDKTISISVPGINTEKKAKKNVYAPYLPDDEKKKLQKKWAIKTAQADEEVEEIFRSNYRDFKRAFNEKFRETWEAEIGEVDMEPSIGLNVEDPPKRLYSQDQELAVIRTMRDWDYHYPGFEDEMALGLEMSYKTEAGATIKLLASTKTPGAVTDAGAVRVLRDEGKEIAEETILKGKRVAMRAIRQGLQSGEGYSAISERIGQAYNNQAKDFPRTTHKIVHEAMANARWDTLEAHGQNEGVWLSAGDDKVRTDPVSHQLDGMILTRAQSMEPDMLPAYECRCSFMPVSPFMEAVKEFEEYEKEQREAVANAA